MLPDSSSKKVDLSIKVKRFYVQRNFYMSLFAVFMLVVLNNRFTQIFMNLELKSSLSEMKNRYSIVKKHNEKLVAEYANSSKCAEELNKKYAAEGSPSEEVVIEKQENNSPVGTRQRKKNNSPKSNGTSG